MRVCLCVCMRTQVCDVCVCVCVCVCITVSFIRNYHMVVDHARLTMFSHDLNRIKIDLG